MFVFSDRNRLGEAQGAHYDRIRWLLPLFERLAGESAIRSIAVDMLGDVTNGVVLDVGCNVGQNTAHLVSATGVVGRVIGIDMAAACVTEARVRAQKSGWLTTEYHVADAHSFHAGERWLDGILMGYCFNVLDDTALAITNLLSQLKPGKRLVICDAQIPAGIRGTWAGSVAERFARSFLCANPIHDPVRSMRIYERNGIVREAGYKEHGYTYASAWEKV